MAECRFGGWLHITARRVHQAAHFVNQTQPQHVIVQAAYGNRYGHPHKAVVRRWLASGAQLWNTANQGAIKVHSSYKGLVLKGLREEQLRYWHVP